MEARTSLDPDLLLAQTDWVQALARKLVGDADEAEDVAQNTLLVALERPPRHADNERSLRAWLARVVRSAAHVGRRSDARRRLREQVAARPERADSTADIVARASQLQLVVGTLMELEEPYRSTLLLAYFDGLSSVEIAQRTGVSDVAVRKRTSRGLAKLRARLDDEHGGDRTAWMAAFAPWIGMRVSEAKAGLGALGQAAAALLAAGAAGGFLLRAPEAAPPAGRVVAVVAPTGAPVDRGAGLGRHPGEGRPASRVGGPGLLAVRVLAADDGRPLEGVPVELDGRGASATDVHGWARFRVPSGEPLAVVARGAELAAADAARAIAPVAPDEARLCTLTLSTAYERLLVGRVVDSETGAPLAGVEVRRAAAPEERVATWSTASPVVARTGADGRFRVPVTRGAALLQLDRAGRAGRFVDADAAGAEPTVSLARAAAVVADVRDRRGRPATGVGVRLTAHAADLGLTGRDVRFLWSAPTDASGAALVDALPPGVAIDAVLVAGAVPAVVDPLELAPGEVRRTSWTLDAGPPVARADAGPGRRTAVGWALSPAGSDLAPRIRGDRSDAPYGHTVDVVADSDGDPGASQATADPGAGGFGPPSPGVLGGRGVTVDPGAFGAAFGDPLATPPGPTLSGAAERTSSRGSTGGSPHGDPAAAAAANGDAPDDETSGNGGDGAAAGFGAAGDPPTAPGELWIASAEPAAWLLVAGPGPVAAGVVVPGAPVRLAVDGPAELLVRSADGLLRIPVTAPPGGQVSVVALR